MGADQPEGRREVSPVFVRVLLRYAARALGEDRLAVLLAQLPGSPTLAELTDRRQWGVSTNVAALADIVAEACGETGIGRRIGAEYFRELVEKGLGDFFLSQGSIPAAVRTLLQEGSKLSNGYLLEVCSVGADELVFEGRYDEPRTGSRYYCDFTAGFYTELPSLFGAFGIVTEQECQLRGYARCRFRLTWRPDPTRVAADEAVVERSARAYDHRLRQLEAMHALAADIVTADGIDGALARITEQAASAVQAPRYMLAVRVSDRDRLRVHQRGFRRRSERDIVTRLLAGELGEEQGVLVAQVSSPRRHFGCLAAFFRPGVVINDWDRRMFDAYAAHASAALELVASAEQARRDRDTAEALLGLARSLTYVGTVPEVAARLTDATPAVADCDVATVWLWQQDAGTLRLVAEAAGPSGVRHVGPRVIAPQRLNRATLEGSESDARILGVEETTGELREVMVRSSLARVAVVPIVSRHRFLGVLAAGFREPHPEEAALLHLLAGLADQAASAFDSALLLESVQHQALHDPLTGLANRALVEDRAVAALSAAASSGEPLSLLFVDLDRFKDVNDTLGHAVGDDLIRAVAQRLEDAVRGADVVARLSGDEFAVLLPGVDEESARPVAARVVERLSHPFVVATGHQVCVSASVGVAVAPQHGIDYPTLLRHADTAMYRAKVRGRGTWDVYAVAARA